jgi:hypothetical protein
MTQKSKAILISSILLAASIIASSVLLIIEVRGAQTSILTIATSGGLILISILSVVFVCLVRIRKRPDEKMLDESYFREFEVIRDAIMNSPLASRYKKSTTEDVLELMLTAQSNGKSVRAAIGDAESFAKGILNAYISRPRSAILGLIDGMMTFLLFTLFISALLWFEDFPTGFFSQKIDIIMVLFYALISFVLIPALRQLTIGKRAWAYFIPIAVGFLFIGIIELLRAFFYNSNLVKSLLDGTIVMIPNIATLAAILVTIAGLFTLRMSIRRLPKLK